MMAHESLPPTQETEMEFPALGFVLAQSWQLRAFGE